MSSLRDAGITVVIFEHKLELLREHTEVIHVLADHQLIASGPSRAMLTDPRLEEWGVGTTRFTAVARAALDTGLLPKTVDLPVSLSDAEPVFAAYATAKKA